MSIERPDELPEITDAVLAQWEAAARVDLAFDRSFSLHPLAILAVIARLREADTGGEQ